MKKYLPTIIIVSVVVLLVGFVVWAMARPESSTTSSTTSQLSQSDLDALKTGGSVGNPNSSVVVTEFGDYQCPACGVWHPFIKNSFLPQFQDKILFVFKNYPLTKPHPNAQEASQAAEAARLQGKFWEMHNLLYETQDEWSSLRDPSNKFEEYAGRIGLNVSQWKKDKDSNTVKDIIKADVALGDKLNLPGTPSFVVNGKLIKTNSEEDLTNAINQALSQAQ